MTTALLDWLTHRDLAQRVREAKAGDAVTLTTAHGSKGLEWPIVFLLDWHPRNEEEAQEERRVFYVGATRARDELQIHAHTEPSVPMTELLAAARSAAA